jgi:hypothetical protein
LDKQKKYIITLHILLSSIVVCLSSLREIRFEVYISLFTVAYFASTALFQPRKKRFDFVGAGLFLVFFFIVIQKIMEIVG